LIGQKSKNDNTDTGIPPDGLPADLTAEMEEMFMSMTQSMGNVDISKSSEQGELHLSEQERKFRKLWEEMLVDGMNGKEDSQAGQELDSLLRDAYNASEPGSSESIKGPPTSASKPANSSNPPSNVDPFQSAIRQAMEKLKSSDDTLKVGGKFIRCSTSSSQCLAKRTRPFRPSDPTTLPTW
jgi:hypothetical protein